MRIGRRLALPIAAAAILLAVGALALVEFDASALGRAALERAGAVTGVTLTARSFRLRPLTGLVLEGVEATGSFTGGRVTASIDRLVLDHRLLRLLRGELAVDRLVLQRPRIRLTETAETRAPARAAAATAAAGLGGLSLRISRIDVVDGTIELQAPGQPRPMVVKGLDLRLRDVALEPGRRPVLAALSAVGDVRAAEVSFAKSRALDLRGGVRLGGGRLKTDTVRFRTDQGPFEATLDADLVRLPLSYGLTLHGQPLDLATILGGRGFGAGTLGLEARGAGAAAEGLRGQGELRVQGGTLPATPLLKAIEQALGRTGVVGAAYQPIEVPFRIEQGRVIVDRAELRTDVASIDVSGWASLAGPLELSLAVHVPRQGLAVRGVAGDALDLMTDPQGRVTVPLRVSGTQEAPRVGPDTSALAAQVRRSGTQKALEKAGQSLGDLLAGKPRGH